MLSPKGVKQLAYTHSSTYQGRSKIGAVWRSHIVMDAIACRGTRFYSLRCMLIGTQCFEVAHHLHLHIALSTQAMLDTNMKTNANAK